MKPSIMWVIFYETLLSIFYVFFLLSHFQNCVPNFDLYIIQFCKKNATKRNFAYSFRATFLIRIKCIAKKEEKKEAKLNLTCWWFHWVSLQVMQSAKEKLALVQFLSSWVLILTGGHSTLRADLDKKIVLIQKDYRSMKGYPII